MLQKEKWKSNLPLKNKQDKLTHPCNTVVPKALRKS